MKTKEAGNKGTGWGLLKDKHLCACLFVKRLLDLRNKLGISTKDKQVT